MVSSFELCYKDDDPCMCYKYIVLRTNWDYSFNIHTPKLNLEKLGGVILMALCVGIIVHPKNIRRKYCSSQ